MVPHSPIFYPNNRDFKESRRQRQRKCYLKIYVRVTFTTSWLFQFVQLVQCSRTELSWNRVCKNGVNVETENLTSCANVLLKTLNLVISRCCLAEDGFLYYKVCTNRSSTKINLDSAVLRMPVNYASTAFFFDIFLVCT